MNYTWKSDLGPEKLPEFEHIKRMITLSVITLRGFHCNLNDFKIKKILILINSFHSLFPATKPMILKTNSTFTNFPNITYSGNILLLLFLWSH
jgi:hypothetical protein